MPSARSVFKLKVIGRGLTIGSVAQRERRTKVQGRRQPSGGHAVQSSPKRPPIWNYKHIVVIESMVVSHERESKWGLSGPTHDRYRYHDVSARRIYGVVLPSQM